MNIPASLTNIGDWVFDACTALTQINVASGNTAYCSENGILFNKDKTTLICYPAGKPETDYTIPSSVTVIGVNAFSDCTTLTSITLPASVTTLEKFAFFNCFRLTKIMVLATTPPTVAHLDAFYSVNSDIPVYVPASSLAAYQAAAVWKEFTNLQAILTGRFTVDNLTYQHQETDPGTVELTNCGNLSGSALDIPATVTYDGNEYTVTSISNGALRDLSLTTITIPHSVNSISGYVFSKCSALTQINVDAANTVYCSENGILFNKDKTTLICYPAGKPETDYTVPDGVTTIGENAFAYAIFTQITLPESLTAIEYYAFYDCTALTQMTVLATVPPTVASHYVFNNVNYSIPVYVPAESLDDYKEADVWKEFSNLQALQTGLQTPSMPESISLQDGMLHNPQGLHLTLYDMQGRQVYSGNDATVSQPAGVYVVRCAGASCKIVF